MPPQPSMDYAPPAVEPNYPPQAPAAGYPPQAPAAGYPPQAPAAGYPPQAPATGYPPQAPGVGYMPQPPGTGYAPTQASGYPYTSTTGYGPPQPGYPPPLSEAPPPAYGPPMQAGVDEEFYPEGGTFDETTEKVQAAAAKSFRNILLVAGCILIIIVGIFLITRQVRRQAQPVKAATEIAAEQQAIELVKSSKTRGGLTVDQAMTSHVEALKKSGKSVNDGGWLATPEGNTSSFGITYILDIDRVRFAYTWRANIKTGSVQPTNNQAQKL